MRGRTARSSRCAGARSGTRVNRRDASPTVPAEPAVRTGANTSATTRVHARVTSPPQFPSTCGVFVPAKTRACPRFPPRNLNGKEGVDGSSPSEGFERSPAIAGLAVF